MEDKLVTLAIHTFEKAQILRTLLETEGIEVCLNNVNQIQPVVSAGVRVRIKESDLPHALRIIEDSKCLDEGEDLTEEGDKKCKVLIPIDFSDYSVKAGEIGFNYAAKMGAEVKLMHAYYSPYFPSAIPIGDTLAYQIDSENEVEHLLDNVTNEMKKTCARIDEKMVKGILPKIQYDYVLREGLPEEEILNYANIYKPSIIIMGTRGKNKKDMDLIGSVTGEVIEANRVPVLAIPEQYPYKDLSEMHDIAFATSFNQRDLLVFDEFMNFVKDFDFNIHLFNISTSHDQWNEIRLAGIHDYLHKQYPDAKITHTVLADGDLLLAVEKFVLEEKIDMIALSTYRRRILSRMFNPSIARRMLFHTDTALFVMHS